MTAPDRNLPPDAQAWGRYIEKRIANLAKDISVAAAAAKAANARTAGAARNAAVAAERAAQLEQSQTAIVEEVVAKDESAWAPLEPANPQHNHHWYDVADGNVLKIYADYGNHERINYVLNPTFRVGTDGWDALGGELATTPEGKGHISGATDGAAAIVETQGRAVVIDVPATEDDGTGSGGEAGQVGALWTASAEVELVESSLSVTATLEVIGPDDEPVSSSGPVVVAYGTPVRITAHPLPGIEGTMDDVRVALSIVNEDEPEFEVTVDEVILEAAEYGEDEEQQFFDGSMPGVLWQGTPHLSTSWWDGQPRWIEAQDEKLKNEVYKTTDEIRDDLDQAAADLAVAQAWIDETGYELGDRLAQAEQELNAARGRLSEAETLLEEAFPSGAFDVEQRLSQTLKTTEIQYAVGTSETTPPTSGWTAETPTRTPGTFVWFRSILTYADDSTVTSAPALLTGNTGAPGDPGDPGAPGTGVTNTAITYAQSTSGTTAPTSGWVASPPAPVAGRYVWTRTIWTYSDGTTKTAYSVGKIGETGAKGDKGDDGLAGKDGVGLASTAITYARSTSGTVAPTAGWTTTVPSPIKGQYLWTRTVWTYTNGSTETGYTTAYWATDGAKGDDGIAGKDGVGIVGTTITYAQSTSGTTAPTTGWAAQPPAPVAGRYIWTRTVWTYSDNTTETGYSVGKIGDTGAKGNAGDKGDQGVSVTSVTPYYRAVAVGSAAPAAPTGATPAGWSTTEPAYNEANDLYRSEQVTYSNGTIVYTPVTKIASYEGIKDAHEAAGRAQNAADTAITSANGKTTVLHDTDPPSGTANPGDIWWQHEAGSGGAPSGTVIGQWRWLVAPAFDAYLYNTTTPYLRVEPLGGGKFRFTPLFNGPITSWSVGGSSSLGDGGTLTYTATSTGELWVRYYDGNGTQQQGTFTVTAAMLAAGTWVKEDVGSEAIANLDVGKLTAGTASVSLGVFEKIVAERAHLIEADIGKLKATTALIDTGVISELWTKVVRSRKITTDMMIVGGSNLIPDPMFEDAELTGGRRSRSSATFTNGNFTTTSYFYFLPSTTMDDVKRYAIPVQPGETYRIEIPVTLSSLLSTTARVEVFTATGARSLQTATFADVSYENGVLAYDYTIPSGYVYMSPVIYRTTSFTVRPGVTVRQKVSSNLIVKGGVTAEHLNVVYPDPVTGNRLSIMPDGLRLWGENDDGEPTISLTTSESQQFAILDDTDQIVAGMSSDGTVLGRVGAFDTLRVDGTDINDRLAMDTSRGFIYNRYFPFERTFYAEGGHSYIHVDMHPSRQYLVMVRTTARNLQANGVHLRFYHQSTAQGNTAPIPTIAHPRAAEGREWIVPGTLSASGPQSIDLSFTHSPSGDSSLPLTEGWQTVSLLLGAIPGISGNTVRVQDAWWTIIDIGPVQNSTRAGGYSTSGGGSAPSNPTPDPQPQRYTRVFKSTSWRTFQNVGTSSESVASSSISGPLQGQTPYYTAAGRYATHFYFDSAAIRSAIGNGTVLSVRVRPRVTHSHSGSGGTVRMYRHGYDASSSSWGSATYIGESHFARGERRWLGATHNPQGWATGANRGIGFYSGGSTSSSYYVQFATQIELEITYER